MKLHYSMEHLLILELCWLIEVAQYKLIFNQSQYYGYVFLTGRIIGHRSIVPQTNNENVTLMVLGEFDCSFCYISFTIWT